MRIIRLAGLLVAAIGLVAPNAHAQDQFPTSAGEARRFYEGNVDDWANGPVDYILQPEERGVWKTLDSTEQRIAFIKWFWDRRDTDTRQVGNKYKEQFYESVAEANRRFRAFPRGWKSDRGRVMCILGKPTTSTRRTWASIYGSGSGPDFEVWTYNTLMRNMGFTTGGGDFYVYFIEERIGKYAIWDFGFRTSGIWDRNIELAFKISMEEAIQDPTSVFEAGNSSGDFVREISEGTLPVEIPLDIWAAAGAGGVVSVPVAIKLSDLLFQPDGEQYVARLNATLELRAPAQPPARVSQAWQVRIAQDELAQVGGASLITALSAAASPGAHDASLVVSHDLAATQAEWKQTVEVSDQPASAMVVGKRLLPLSDTDDSAVAIVRPTELAFESGASIVVGIWARGAQPDMEALAVELESTTTGTHRLRLDSTRWLGGAAGPLVVEAHLPEVEAGEYRMRVDLGGGLEAAATMLQITR